MAALDTGIEWESDRVALGHDRSWSSAQIEAHAADAALGWRCWFQTPPKSPFARPAKKISGRSGKGQKGVRIKSNIYQIEGWLHCTAAAAGLFWLLLFTSAGASHSIVSLLGSIICCKEGKRVEKMNKELKEQVKADVVCESDHRAMGIGIGWLWWWPRWTCLHTARGCPGTRACKCILPCTACAQGRRERERDVSSQHTLLRSACHKITLFSTLSFLCPLSTGTCFL